jgi:hypothetical protein
MAPLIQTLLGSLLTAGVKKVAPKVVDKVVTIILPKPAIPNTKDTIVNPAFLGAMRHIIQVGAGAMGAESLASGDGLSLAVAVAVSVANLGWFLIQSFMARKAA